ncbi:hypothetical protein [Acutalibacter sp. 1XD8-33]|uniref:hypothetical protein n=1 Tax=Acutalibacter sp. 1XD8-33 TaxID=2320081 RepID=UPI0011C41E99|nr:hypothetical protein [Acutalibacter sp. 1XD8-33]
MDSTTASQNLADSTPLWVTIIGWGITLLAAVLPSIFNFFSTRHLRKDVEALQNAKKQAIDKVKFVEQRIGIISNLEKFIKALESDVKGKSTVANLSRTLATVQSYAERLGFSTTDKKEITDLLELTRDMQMNSTLRCNITPDMIQSIIEILSKGEYLA